MANNHKIMYPLGVTITESGAEILVQSKAEKVELLLFKKGETEACERFEFDVQNRIGDVWTMSLEGYDFKDMEYGFEADGEWFVDPCAKAIVGKEVWGAGADSEEPVNERAVRARVLTDMFTWEDDEALEIPYADTVIYRLHVRGFTQHPSSFVKHKKNKGTFAGLIQMIPYLKDLGITAVELMPITEFDEVIKEEVSAAVPGGKTEKKATGKINFWGYGPSYLYAPKASYGTGAMPVEMELKIMIQEFHRAGIEVITEMHFTGEEAPAEVLNVLRYWVQEYHVDGFKLSGQVATELVAADPFLSNKKLFADDWKNAISKNGKKAAASGTKKAAPVTVRGKNLAVYNEKFQEVMRKVLRGDQSMVSSLMEWTGKNPAEYGQINYMANTSGFTMMDMVSYEEKHNEANGEENQDGTNNNCSFNCGAEGPTEDAKIIRLREQQMRNAFMMLMLSQGTPLIMAGDEFGNSQNGNNNAYCQDNEIGWVDWNALHDNFLQFSFVRDLIKFRKYHKVFHKDYEAKRADYLSLGNPDVSYHGQNAWKVDVEYFRKQLGIMYCGAYDTKTDGTPDETFYVAYNMHWGTHRLGLPRLPKGMVWKAAMDTSGGYVTIKDKVHAQIPPHTVALFVATGESGFCVYDTPVGKVTIACVDGKICELRFGDVIPECMMFEYENPETGAVERAQLYEISESPEKAPGILQEAEKQLKEYFDGKRKVFDLPLHHAGTEFQEKVWNALKTIPYGETRSYKDIAVQIGNDNASIAVGMANSRNPLSIFIPCHRVIGKDGNLVGYAGGMEVKEKLLELEKQYNN